MCSSDLFLRTTAEIRLQRGGKLHFMRAQHRYEGTKLTTTPLERTSSPTVKGLPALAHEIDDHLERTTRFELATLTLAR